ncbi:hypothetical protein BZZ01_18025 [Nostocales cyanobacterium HT-58-2]|nr:hypothetical protein BZZ01_18025 [Nostocales cyanobacterium HT-58-2]
MYINRFYFLQKLGYSVVTTIYVQLEFEKGYTSSRDYFFNLLSTGEITPYTLEIDDLVEMANVPQSKKASDAELSCFVLAKRIGGKAMTDDKTAINYILRHILISKESVITLLDVLFEAYLNSWLSDNDLRAIQSTLSANKFRINDDLVFEFARRRLMTQK